MKISNSKSFTLAAIISILILMLGLSYAAVPLYRFFCQATGYGGTVTISDYSNLMAVTPESPKLIKIIFNSDTSSDIPWRFTPTQRELYVTPGETALAFYSVENPTSETITGVATYNVAPSRAGLYFNKIQCFCFEQQEVQPNEKLDMPVFFFLDPELLNDKQLSGLTDITLSYTFFKVN